jgi:alpha-amylase/alpha-mannosidase (GH57 family)
MTKVAILWHMHQPFYEDLATGEHIMPWVRLHALKDYFGMVALLREFPKVRMTFNLVPSLLVQIEAFANASARDRFLELGLKPAAQLTEDERTFVVANFFHAQRARMIDVYPRYAELFEQRERARRGGISGDLSAREQARVFDEASLRDLQVWQKLAWIDPMYLAEDPRVRALVKQDRGFSEEDKNTLRAVELELLQRVIPEYRAAADRGQVELSVSPFYHPILPLLCDTDVYLRNDPQARLPRQRFHHPEDAREQLTRAVTYFEKLFGRRPQGLWPSEGSVSDDMVPLAAEAGIRWMATDEIILARSLGRPLPRSGHDRLEHPELLYRPYRLATPHGDLACLFRDHALSDLIGFSYSNWSPHDAGRDLIDRLADAGRRYSERTGGEEATISVILDGENAWEHYEGGGRPFLRSLYQGLSEHAELRTVTMAEAAAGPTERLRTLYPGSWVNGDFYIWIGHTDDRKAWGQLAEARDTYTQCADSDSLDAGAKARAFEEILIAEGSDWCWWYGDDHSSGHDLEFDDLFRRHLRNVYRLLRKPVPEELYVSNISSPPTQGAIVQPAGFVRPLIDGEVSNYFEWLGAGLVDGHDLAGTMHQADAPANRLVTALHFGFDLRRLFIRVDMARRAADVLASGRFSCRLIFLVPTTLRLDLIRDGSKWQAVIAAPEPDERGTPLRTPIEGQADVGDILEFAISLDTLGVKPGDALAFSISVLDEGVEVQRYPGFSAIETHVPTSQLEELNWRA